MTFLFDQKCQSRVERETSKFLEIDNIFHRLRSSDQVGLIYNMYRTIFEREHRFTIDELTNLAHQKVTDLTEFNLPEQYKLNSHIFKQNLTLISNIIIEDIWFQFNCLVTSEPLNVQQKQKAWLFKIEEEMEQQKTDSENPHQMIQIPKIMTNTFNTLQNGQPVEEIIQQEDSPVGKRTIISNPKNKDKLVLDFKKLSNSVMTTPRLNNQDKSAQQLLKVQEISNSKIVNQSTFSVVSNYGNRYNQQLIQKNKKGQQIQLLYHNRSQCQLQPNQSRQKQEKIPVRKNKFKYLFRTLQLTAVKSLIKMICRHPIRLLVI